MSELYYELGGPYMVGHAIGTPAATGSGSRKPVGFTPDGEQPAGGGLNREVLVVAVDALERLAVYPGEHVYHEPDDVEQGQLALRLLRAELA